MLITADRIDRWASETVGADAIFPELIRRLAHALNDTLTHVDIPSGTSIRLGGWDGLTRATVATSFVPDGDTAWECSVEAKPTTKANSDYQKRTANPLGLNRSVSTYVFCTPRKWSTRKKWAKERCAANEWKEVRAVDAHELVTLFERAPAVHDWFMRQLGLSPPGSFAATDWLSDYLLATDPPLDSACLLINHKAAQQRIVNFISAAKSPSSKPHSVVARTVEDAISFCIAAISEIEDESQRFHAISRALVVENADAWKILCAVNFTSLVLIPKFNLTETDLGRARNHRVIIAATESTQPTGPLCIDTRSSDSNNHLLTDKLTELGIPPFRAERLVGESDGRIAVLRKRFLKASVTLPPWSAKEHAAVVASFLLCGEWARDNQNDIVVVSQITGLSATQIESIVSPWAQSSPPLFKMQTTAIQLDAIGEAWQWLAPAIPGASWERFFAQAKEVLSEINPKFELPEDERWYANIRGKVPEHSGLLRGAMCTALARLSAETRCMQLPNGFHQNESCVEYQCRKLFEGNVSAERFLCSIANELPTIAEAAPDAFLAALQRDLDGPRYVDRMFEGNVWHGSSGHAYLLWALERLAWSKDHFTLAVRILARLCATPLPENIGNTPFASLASIFKGWQVATTISFAERLKSLDALFKLNEDVAWRLTLSLLPHWGGASLVPHGPSFRSWADDAPRRVLQHDYLEYCHEVLIIACREVSNHSAHCITLLERLFNHHATEQQLIIAAVEKFVANHPQSDVANTNLWIAVKKALYRRRAKKDEESTEATEVRNRLLVTHDTLVPLNLPSRFAWLFANNQGDLPLPNLTDIWSDWQARNSVIKAAQQQAITALAGVGIEEILATASLCENVWLFGVLVAETKLVDLDVVLPLLTASEASHRQFASAFVNSHTRGTSGMSELLSQDALTKLSDDAQLAYLASLSATLATFTYVSTLPSALSAKYWHTNDFQWIDEDAHVYAAREYLRANRPLNAVNALNLRLRWEDSGPALQNDDDAQLVHDVLSAVFRVDSSNEETAKRFGSEAYYMGQLLFALASSSFDQEMVARLEFTFLPIGRSLHNWEPRALLAEIGKSHVQFCELLKLACYKRDDGILEDVEQTAGVAANARQLLDKEAWYPANQRGNEANVNEVREWIQRAVQLASESNQSQIATRLIAKSLGRLGKRSGAHWPSDAMAELLEHMYSEFFMHEVIDGEMYGFGLRSVEAATDAKRAVELDQRADEIRLTFPHTASLLRRLALAYRREHL